MMTLCCAVHAIGSDVLNSPPYSLSQQQKITDHVWMIGELVEAALHEAIAEPQGGKNGRFGVIDRGKP
jgi:hypothetical protein